MRASIRSFLVASFLFVVPDVVPPDTKPIEVTTKLELGPLADTMRMHYEVQKGDTMTSIAKTRLGAAERTADLAAANPGVDPDKLAVGQLLWLPAKDPAVKGACLWVGMTPSRDPMPWVANKALPHARYGVYTLYVVPSGLLDGATGDAKKRDALLASDKVERIEGRTIGRYQPKNSPVHRAEATLTVVAAADGTLKIETKVVWYDAEGKVLPVGADGNVVAPKPKKSLFLLLLLSLCGGGWLVWRARQRAPQLALA